MSKGNTLRNAKGEKKDEFYISLSLNIFSLLLNDSHEVKNMSRSNTSYSSIGGVV